MRYFSARLAQTVVFGAIVGLIAGCGGGASPEHSGLPASAELGQPHDSVTTPNPVQMLSARQLLAWAEKTYPSVLPPNYPYPDNEKNSYWDLFAYRRYSTGNYLGVAGQSVYLLGPAAGNALQNLGPLSQFACRINPASCRTSVASTAPLFITDHVHCEIAVVQDALTSGAAVRTNLFSIDECLGKNSFYDAAKDRLYVLSSAPPDTRVWLRIIDAASTASGLVKPSRSIELAVPSTDGARYASLYLDRTNDTLYVGGGARSQSGQATGYLAAFEKFSSAESKLSPTRTMTFPAGSVEAFAVDTTRSIAYVGFDRWLVAVPNIRTAAGPVTVTSDKAGTAGVSSTCYSPGMVCRINVSGIAVDEARNRLYVASNSSSSGLMILNSASDMNYVGDFIPIPDAQAVAYDARADRLYFGAYYNSYVFNASNTLKRGDTLATTALTLLGTPYSTMTGFAFP